MEITKEILISIITEELNFYGVDLNESEKEELGNKLMKEFKEKHPTTTLNSREFTQLFAEFIAEFLPSIGKKLTNDSEEKQFDDNPKLSFIMDIEELFDKYNSGINEELVRLKELNEELSLFNSKLAFVNKLLMAKNWTYEEKIKFCEQFDRAETNEEIQALYKRIIEDNK